ncbi:alpha/beta-hydrolase [Pholiota conissans]|uniref:Alpha/beta-hydrolase n=1 Tax=Pholiota conissans TaxID=109636 RepID=A0A9P6D125_9AGAR|nr:alpha/beta-hydrolase [Pholiota conissans]
MTSPETPFKIAVPDASLTLLQKKLELATFPDELNEAGWGYGAPLADIKRLVARWREGYDWRKYEAHLNDELPQFAKDIEVEGFGTLNVHYVHKRSEVVDAIPLLFVHGWPGSFLEVRKVLPLLVESSLDHPSFHVVALSLPGFGFSEAPKKTGFALGQFAETCNKLMLALGYNEYVTQGGDWGHMITHRVAKDYGPKHSKAMHSNFPLGIAPHPIKAPLLLLSHILNRYSASEKEGLKRTEDYLKNGSGYVAQQSTRPQTLGYGLADSPVGLLAWIYEKLVLWTDNYPWDDDEVLTWVSIYWFSRAGSAASLRIYYEVQHDSPEIFRSDQGTAIPMGFSFFPKEIVRLPRKWVKTRNLVFESVEHESGGHFAAHEKPELLVGDVRKMFGKSGPAYGVVPGKTGYA